MSAVRALTLTVRLLLELALLAALSFWGFAVGHRATAFLLGIGAPLLAAAVWGMFVAPKAMWPVELPVRLLIELLLFGAAAVALAAAGLPVTALVFGALAITTSVLNAAQERSSKPTPMRL